MLKKVVMGFLCGVVLSSCTSSYVSKKSLYKKEVPYSVIDVNSFNKESVPVYSCNVREKNSYFEDYSLAVAKKDSFFFKKPEDAAHTLVNLLEGRTFTYRFDADYEEHPKQLYNVDDSVALSLIKQYVELFDSFSKKDFRRLFPEKYSDESGGIIIYDKKLKLVPFENCVVDSLKKSNYQNEEMITYSRIGVFHSHSLNEDVLELVENDYYRYAGPSSAPRRIVSFFHSIGTGDIGYFKANLSFNSYFMDAVITQLPIETDPESVDYKKERFNVDVYFKPPQHSLYVIDIGTYSFPKN